MLLIFARYVKETLIKTEKLEAWNLTGAIREAFGSTRKRVKFYTAAVAGRFTFALRAGIFYAMLMETFGFNLIQLGLLANVVSVYSTLSQLFFGKLVYRYGERRFMILSLVLHSMAYMGFFRSGSFTGFLVSQLLIGLGN